MTWPPVIRSELIARERKQSGARQQEVCKQAALCLVSPPVETGIRDFGLLEFGADVLALVRRVPVSAASAQHRSAGQNRRHYSEAVARLRCRGKTMPQELDDAAILGAGSNPLRRCFAG